MSDDGFVTVPIKRYGFTPQSTGQMRRLALEAIDARWLYFSGDESIDEEFFLSVVALAARVESCGLKPGEIVAVPSELPPARLEQLEGYDPDADGGMGGGWLPLTEMAWAWNCRLICRPINKEAGQ